MKKQDYKSKVSEQKDIIRAANEKINELRDEFIESNKPCKKGDMIEIVLHSGRKVKGQAVSFGILQDKNVHVTAYKVGAKTKYISVPNQSVNVI